MTTWQFIERCFVVGERSSKTVDSSIRNNKSFWSKVNHNTKKTKAHETANPPHTPSRAGFTFSVLLCVRGCFETVPISPKYLIIFYIYTMKIN